MKKLVMALALVLAATTMFAQDNEQAKHQRWVNYQTNRFVDNWEISAAAGVNGFVHSAAHKYGVRLNPGKVGDVIGFTFNVNVGKWFTPIIGARIGFQGLNFKNYAITPQAPEDGAENLNKYYSVGGDFLINLTNWICHYKADRFYNAIVGVGIAYMNTKPDGDTNVYGVKTSDDWNDSWTMPITWINRFRLCSNWTFDIQLQDVITPPDFANDRRGDMFGNLLSATAGFTWKFSKVDDFQGYEPIDKAAYDNRISSLERDLQNANDQNAEYQKQIERYKQQLSDKERQLQEALANAAKEKPAMANDDVTLSIFFPIGSSEISDKNTVNIKYLANVIKASNKTYTVTGYADANTGSEQRNQKLSQERAESVYNALIDAGVNKDQLKVDYKGCSVQPFDKDYLNRVAIIK